MIVIRFAKASNLITESAADGKNEIHRPIRAAIKYGNDQK